MDSKEWRLLFLKNLRIINDAPEEQRDALIESLSKEDDVMKEHLLRAVEQQKKNDASVDPTSETLVPKFDSLSIPSATPPKGPHDLGGHRLNGKYLILKRLGRGAQGTVYLALNENLREFVAIKVLTSPLRKFSYVKDRFAQEGHVLARLRHPNICSVLDMDFSEEGWPFIVMEYLEGNTLASRIKQDGAMDLDTLISVIKQVAEALKVAHRKNIIHQDIKPSNIFLCEDENKTIKLLDFGVAQLVTEQTGSSGGTLPYMSPEQMRGEQVTFSTDVWSLGVTALELLEGEHPFESTAKNLEAYCDAVMGKEAFVMPPEISQIPKELLHFLKVCLKKKGEERYRTAQYVQEAITRLDERIKQKKKNRKLAFHVVMISSLAIFLLIGSYLIFPPDQVIGGERNIGVTFTGGDALLAQGSEHIESWLSAELDLMIAEILQDESRHRMVSKQEIEFEQTFDTGLLELAVSFDVGEDSTYVYMMMQDRNGRHQGMPQRISIGRTTYREDRYEIYIAAQNLLEQYRPPVLNLASAENEELLDEVNADSLLRLEEEDTLSGLDEYHEINSDTTWLPQGLYHLVRGNYGAAERIFRSILLEDPQHAPALISMAETKWYLGEPEKADSLYALADSLNPNDFSIMEWWAFMSIKRNNLDRADSLFQQCIALHPEEPASYRNWGSVLIDKSLENEDLRVYYEDQAQEAFYMALEHGEDAYSYANIGYLLSKKRFFVEASNKYRKALALDSTDYLNWGELADMFKEIPTKRDSAAYFYNRAIEIALPTFLEFPNDASLAIDLAYYYAELGDTLRAQDFRSQYIEIVSTLEHRDRYLEHTLHQVDSLLAMSE